ncbi:ABC transporter ATP-binding protein [Clostridium sp. AM58-1XD]|uniref:ABC transporter ATP-binding protein n=1 Tax=Clostridium sp. AM58-1XD TaxID=2292307 RepID=UPI000E51CCAA|nr:ABC transporter ATP-binding protein [Clostridium sp. AM58-1XD]RGY97952.1 ABC transporter ATP-binding protein [Clostridium sp. AM58-1XD]
MKIILRFLKPHKRLCIFTMLVMLLDVAGGLLIPTLTADLINIGVEGGNIQYIFRNGIIMLGVTVLTSFGTLMGSYLCADLSARIGRDMRNVLYDKSLAFSSHDFEEFGTGSMITRTLSDVNIIQQSIVWCIQLVIPVPAMCIMGIVMAFSIDFMMGLLLIAVTGVIVILAVLVTRKASLILEKFQSFLDRMNVVLRENLTGVRVIRAFNKERYEEGRMKKSFEDYAEAVIKANQLFVSLESTALLGINLCIVAILWIGGNRIGSGYMKIGDITALTQYAVLILYYIIMAQMVFLVLPRAHICIGRIGEVLAKKPEIADGMTAGPGIGQKEQVVVSFQNVAFRFADADEDTLENLTFSCKRGETTAIIGSTGSGKSTIAKLILRFHDATAGSVQLNGRDIREMTQRELRDLIAYVPQKAWLFSGTIADNLRYGNDLAEKEDMEHALAAAQAEFVNTLPDGLAANVAQGGTNFSGGQKQRLSIARALMKRAELYIFDDSFSALDFKTDAALRKALIDETKEAAVLIIAQRISTILHAEQIIALEDGKIAGIGNHSQLMKTCAVYQDIAKSQMKGGYDGE